MLEYLKVLMTSSFLYSLVAIVFILLFKTELRGLISRIASIKLPGGAEVTAAQAPVEERKAKPQEVVETTAIVGLPDGLTERQRTSVEKLIRAHIATEYLWEYRYLNYFLVRTTQDVLDWLITLEQPTTYALYDAAWRPAIASPSERRAIIDALQAHFLIQVDGTGAVTTTPKGREYQQWRGALPALPTSPAP